MTNRTEPSVLGALLHSGPALTVPYRRQQQGIADQRLSEGKSAQDSQLAKIAATTGAGKLGYGALAFWIVVAALIAARIAFLDPSRIQSASSLLGAKPTSAWTMGDSPSPMKTERY